MSLSYPRRRCRFRSFTLRTFVLAVTVIAVCGGGLIESERRQQAAIEKLLAAGGSYQLDSDAWKNANDASLIRIWLNAALTTDYFDRVVRIKFVSPEAGRFQVLTGFPRSYLGLPNTLRTGHAWEPLYPLTDEALEIIGRFSHLRELEVYSDYCELTDNAMKGVRNLTRLESLTLSILPRDLRRSTFGDAGLANLSHLTALRSLTLDCRSITDGGVTHLRGLTNLQHLDLQGTRVTEQCLADFVAFTNLRTLRLPTIELTDAGAASLAKLPQLGLPHDIKLKVTDRGVEYLSALHGVERLILNRSPEVGDVGVQHLRNVGTLHTLSLGGTRITDAALDDIARLPQLRELYLSGTAVTDAGISKLRGMQLEVLGISYCQITDASLATLCQMPLRKLVAHGSKISDSGFAEIQHKVPRTAIHK